MGKGYPTISAANDKIIMTWSEVDLNLFSYEDDEWTQTDVKFPHQIISSTHGLKLVTVKNLKSKR